MNTYRTSTGKTLNVNCRVCKKAILKQNYRDHLKNVHPTEDSSDLRTHGQSKLSFSVKSKCDRSSSDDDDENVKLGCRRKHVEKCVTVGGSCSENVPITSKKRKVDTSDDDDDEYIKLGRRRDHVE